MSVLATLVIAPVLLLTLSTPVFATAVPVTLIPEPAVTTVIAALPSKLTPWIFRAVARVVAVLALPVSAAVMVPAEKLPLPSRATMADAVLVLAAVVALLLTLPAVLIVASIVPVTVPVSPEVITVPLILGR